MTRSPLVAGTLALLIALAGSARAAPGGEPAKPAAPSEDPLDPYGPSAPTPAPTPPDPAPAAPAPVAPAPIAPVPAVPVPAAPAAPAAPDPSAALLAEEIAFSVASRAQQLLDAKQYADAKQLALEAIARSPNGVAAERARIIVTAANAGLGIVDEQPLEPVPDEPAPQPQDAPPPTADHADIPSARRVAQVHSGLAGGLVGATLGGLVNDSAGVEVAVGAVGAAAGAYFLPRLLTRYDAEQVRTIGSASIWGGVVGGLLADVTTGLSGTSPRQVLIGATLGSAATTAGGLFLARKRSFTRGDVALVDTLASIGAVGGLTLGLAMQPVETEGYSLNAVLGAAAGVVTGMIAAPQTDTTQRRVLYMAGGAAAGGAVPWLVYLAVSDDETNNDEQAIGLLSTAGLVAGAYLGLRFSRHLATGADVHERQAFDDAPPALLRRASNGQLAFGGVGLRTSQQAPQPAYVLDLLAGRF